MKIDVSVKMPDISSMAKCDFFQQVDYDPDHPMEEVLNDLLSKFVQNGEYIKLEFDLVTKTVKVVPFK